VLRKGEFSMSKKEIAVEFVIPTAFALSIDLLLALVFSASL
jgi:hypothetical protein